MFGIGLKLTLMIVAFPLTVKYIFGNFSHGFSQKNDEIHKMGKFQSRPLTPSDKVAIVK